MEHRQEIKHLLHIGYPKAGSTFLQEWFLKHPELAYENGGIGGFYNLYSLIRAVCYGNTQGLKYFVSSFEGLIIPNDSAGSIWQKEPFGKNISEEFIKDQQEVCRILKNIFPSAKVLIITRGYKGLLQSAYSQYLRTGGNKTFQEFSFFFSTEEKKHYVNYDAIIDLYGKRFGRENLIIMPYELLRDNKIEFLSILENELDIKHEPLEIGIVNPSFTDQEKYWYQKISFLAEKTFKLFGNKVYVKTYTLYVNKVFHNRLNRLIKILIAMLPDKKQTTEISDENVKWIAKGGSLSSIPLYEKYKEEYYLD